MKAKAKAAVKITPAMVKRAAAAIDVVPLEDVVNEWRDGNELYVSHWGGSDVDRWLEECATRALEMALYNRFTQKCVWDACEEAFVSRSPRKAIDDMLNHIWYDHMTEDQRKAWRKKCRKSRAT